METRDELKKRWAKDISKFLVGRKIIKVTYQDDKALEEFGWHECGVQIHLSDGAILTPMRDDEGNGPGAIATNYLKLEVIPVI